MIIFHTDSIYRLAFVKEEEHFCAVRSKYFGINFTIFVSTSHNDTSQLIVFLSIQNLRQICGFVGFAVARHKVNTKLPGLFYVHPFYNTQNDSFTNFWVLCDIL